MAAAAFNPSGRFQNKVIFITGAASGIGRAAALRLANEGADIGAFDLSADGLQRLGGEIESLGRRVFTKDGDVSDLDALEAAFMHACDVLGGLDGLVNNAGIGGPMQRFDKVAGSDFDRMVAINLKPVWRAMQLACDPMRARGGGAIVNVSSMAGLRPNRTHALYGMTKAAVISLTQHCAMDYAALGIRVNALCPGPVETPIFQQMRAALGEDNYEAARGRVLQRTLVKRFGDADEQAAAIAYLLSDEAAFVTGVAMPVDGGWSVADGAL